MTGEPGRPRPSDLLCVRRGVCMPIISTSQLQDRVTEHSGDTIRLGVTEFAQLIARQGVSFVRIWCSCNPDLPDDSPLQSPEEIIPPAMIVSFLDKAVTNSVWSYGDNWNRAGIDALDGSFKLLLGNDKNIVLDTSSAHLFNAVRSAWIASGYEVFEGDGRNWIRSKPVSG